MLTRLVRVQLIVFTIASVIGITVMAISYLQAPAMLGVGRIMVRVELPSGGGLYRFGNVTYRGVQVGKVVDVRATHQGAEATLSLDASPPIPAALHAAVRSVSAVGEQYIDLQPRNQSPPYLGDGSVIAMQDTSVPQEVGPMLDQVSALVSSIPKDRLSDLLKESFTAFNGAGDDLGSLLDSSATILRDAHNVAGQTRSLVEQSGPLLDAQAHSADALRLWARSTAGITDQVVANDPQLRAVLDAGPGAAQQVSKLLDQVKPTLPILLANLTSIGQVAVTYHPSIQQLLVLLPPYVSFTQSVAGFNNPTGFPLGDFALTAGDPPACTTGFLPPSSWRSPADLSDIDTPDGLYCKLPQDSPVAVRGARNYPCMGKPGKRAPTVQLCDSDAPFEPLAQRQHSLGPYPLDPNLISQGIPPDDRVTADQNIQAPVEGTPLAPETTLPAAAPPTPSDPAIGAGPEVTGPAPAAPAGLSSTPTAEPEVAVAQYDPATGRYAAPDGHLYTQSELVKPATTWQELMPR